MTTKSDMARFGNEIANEAVERMQKAFPDEFPDIALLACLIATDPHDFDGDVRAAWRLYEDQH